MGKTQLPGETTPSGSPLCHGPGPFCRPQEGELRSPPSNGVPLELIKETKLADLSLRIQQIETTLNILDAKLSSIPGLDDVTVEVSPLNVTSVTNGAHPEATSEQPQQSSTQDSGLQESEVSAENILTVAKDPRYARYLKMVQVGVPVMAIRNKMISEGLDPDLLERPDAPVPDGESEKTVEESSDSESSFSD
ncbi:WASH complex subunit 3 isoform X5 [Macaca nemestrina]|uniref:WASH complex subunit 3 isoform X5 n=1 Tax=Macaca nemestrina TaxID=9545 RepID=UPI0005F44D90|nr:WASH complex subunit 3 isoform X6 [Macaca nemestrina]XP_015008090.1 WASH complex subunit 3 isoform X7 [Macaca mulatta]XP_045221720.1 WASH complex subunit 3 isoform X5 [Macaca fascicularis]